MAHNRILWLVYVLAILTVCSHCQSQRKRPQNPSKWKQVNDPTKDTLAHRRKRLLETWPQFVLKEAIMKTDSGARGLYPEYSRLVKYLSALTHVENLPLDFVIVGASTGQMDNFINKFLVMPHWRGVFIEPDEVNYNMMVLEFAKYNITTESERAYLVRSAVSNACTNGQISMYKPTAPADKNATHAVLHELGSINKDLVENSVKNMLQSGYASVHMTVPCQSMSQVLQAANAHFTRNKTEIFIRHLIYNTSEYVTFVPMVVRVDTEGHDAVVMHDLFKALDNALHSTASSIKHNNIVHPQGNSDESQKLVGATSIADIHTEQSADEPHYICEFSPLLLFWEQNKLSKAEYTSLNDALHSRGYRTHEDYFIGRWRAQDMYAVLSPQSHHYHERCKGVPLEEGVFL